MIVSVKKSAYTYTIICKGEKNQYLGVETQPNLSIRVWSLMKTIQRNNFDSFVVIRKSVESYKME